MIVRIEYEGGRTTLCDAAVIGACYREHVGPPSKPLRSQIGAYSARWGGRMSRARAGTSWRGCSRKRRKRAPLKITLGFFVWLFRAVFKWVM